MEDNLSPNFHLQMHVLCYKPPFICFFSSGVALLMNLKFLTKVITTNTKQMIHNLVMHLEMDNVCGLCVPKVYL